MQVVDGGPVFDRFVAKVVGATVLNTPFDATSGKPHGKGIGVVIATCAVALRVGCASEFAAPDHQSLVLLRRNELPSGAVVRRVLGALVVKPHLARGFLEIAYCVVRKEEQRNGIGSRLISELKKHAVSIGVLHLLTYADDSATGFFERLGFDANAEANGMELNRFHWGISHYTGSQLRQCALDPDGVTLYPPSYPRRTPHWGRRLFHRPPAAAAPPAAAEAGGTSGAAEGEQ